MAEQPVQNKKPKIYPIGLQLKCSAGTPLQAKIVKLVQNGFLAEVAASGLQPGDKFEATFELPVVLHTITEKSVIVKLYNNWSGSQPAIPINPQGPRPALVEIHFSAPSLATKEKIGVCLKATGQAAG